MNRLSRSDRKGFTLLEAMITMVLLATGVTAVFSLFSMTTTLDSDNEYTAIAISLGQEAMEEIKDAGSYADIDSMSAARTNVGGDFSDFDREVTVAGDPKQVNVKVYWTDKGVDHNVELVTLLADYDY
ncbi:MAG: prepilin-type N-terminal cleavage/methylation domain-containing protein [Candidatus Omnitrophota bacterium]